MSGDKKYNRDVDRIIYNFGKSLTPNDDFVAEGRQLAHKVFMTLQHLSDFTVAEVRYGGSFGKDTAVIEPDLDLYIVVNGCEPSEDYQQLLEEFQEILEANCDDLEIDPESIKGREKLDKNIPFNSIQFKFLNGIEVDLLPATYMDPEEVVEAIGENPTKENVNIFNTSFITKILQFMGEENCDEFTRTLVRLSKFWLKSLSFGPDARVKGGSSLMEIVAFAAGQEENKKFGGGNRKSILRAFERVIKMMNNLDTLKLVLEQNGNGKWHRVGQNRLASNDNRVLKKLVPDVVGFQKILRRKCFIVDPINPYCDRINDQQKNVLDQLMDYAGVTLDRIEKLKTLDSNICVMGGGRVKGRGRGHTVNGVLLTKLFKPQPGRLTSLYKEGIPSDFIFIFEDPDDDDDDDFYFDDDDDDDDDDDSEDLLMTEVDVKNDYAMENRAFRKFVEKLTWNIKATIHGSLGSFKNPSEDAVEDAKDAVDRLIQNTFNERTVDISDADYLHEEMDVTVTIPFKCPVSGDIHSVKLSMDKDNNEWFW